MNIQTKPLRTGAEQKLMESFSARRGELPGGSAAAAMRDRLIGELQASGLPSRKVESWHYTDLRTLLRSLPTGHAAGGIAPLEPLVEGASVLTVSNASETGGQAPAGAKAKPFAATLSDAAAVELLADQGADDAIGRINGAFVSGGLSLEIADGAKLDTPLEVQVLQSGGQAHTRFPAKVGAGVKATVIERHCAVGGTEALTTSITDLSVGAGTELVWIVLQQQGAADTHLGQINLRLGTDARLMLYVVNAGGHLVRHEIRGVVEGEGADMKLRGIDLLGGDSHTDVTLVLDHDAPGTTSTEIVRNVVFDRARGAFQGQIRVAANAQKTDARMACNTLLLSEEGEFSTKPELEIYADDVQCGHGATVADIDESHLFYLMSRGVPEKRARAMLVNGFVAEIVEELEDEALIAALEAVITEWLEAHG